MIPATFKHLFNSRVIANSLHFHIARARQSEWFHIGNCEPCCSFSAQQHFSAIKAGAACVRARVITGMYWYVGKCVWRGKCGISKLEVTATARLLPPVNLYKIKNTTKLSSPPETTAPIEKRVVSGCDCIINKGAHLNRHWSGQPCGRSPHKSAAVLAVNPR